MISLWILPLATLGLLVASYLLYKKTSNQKLVCLIGEDCDRVVKSKYGYLLGIPNELFGIIYYLGIMSMGIFPIPIFILFLPIIAGLALLASLYLLGIQAFILYAWCEYCIATAVANFLIFLLII